MKAQVISIGNKIDLRKISNTETLISKKVYISQILDFIDDEQAKIAMPIENGKIIPLDIGDNYELCFYTPKGLYQCRGIIRERYKESNIVVAVVQFVSALEKFQRRQYYRLEFIMDVEYRIVTKQEMELTKQLEEDNFFNEDIKVKVQEKVDSLQKGWCKATTTDISGGGARLTSDLLHQKNDRMLIRISLNTSGGIRTMELKSHIISSEKLPNRHGKCEHRVEFSEIGIKQREIIIKFVFEEERKQRRKEKGLD